MVSLQDLFISIGIKADDAALGKINRGLNKMKQSLGGVHSALGALAVAFGFQRTTGFIFKATNEMEQLNVAFETMIGNSKEAAKFMGQLRELTLRTPFKFQETAEGAKRLLAMGFEVNKVIPSLEMLGNIAAGVGREKLPQLILALGQVKTATKLRGQELRQFTEAGVPMLEELSKVLGKSTKVIQEMISKGEVSFDAVAQALKNSTLEGGRFFNLMIKQSKTIGGLVSILQDNLYFLAATIGKDLLPEAKKLVVDFTNWLAVNKEIIKTNIVGFFKNVIKAVQFLIDHMDSVIFVFKLFISYIGILIATRIISFFHGLYLALMGVHAVLVAMTGAQLINIATWIALGALLSAFLLILEDIYVYFAGGKSLIGEMAKGNPILKGWLDQLGVIGKLVASIVALFTGEFRAAWMLFRDAWIEFANFFLSFFGTNLDNLWAKLMDFLKKTKEEIFSFGKAFQSLFKGDFAGALKNLKASVGMENIVENRFIPESTPFMPSSLPVSNSSSVSVGDVNISLQNPVNASPVELGEMFQNKMDQILYSAQTNLSSPKKR